MNRNLLLLILNLKRDVRIGITSMKEGPVLVERKFTIRRVELAVFQRKG